MSTTSFAKRMAFFVSMFLLGGTITTAQELYCGNLLENFSMEEGGWTNVEGWARTGSVFRHDITGYGFTGYSMMDGNWAVKMSGCNTDLSQHNIPVIPGERYTASGWFYHSSAEDRITSSVWSTRMYLRVAWYDSAGRFLLNDYSANHNGLSPADWWTRISFDAYAPFDASYATFHVQSDSGEGGGSVFGDAFFFGLSTQTSGPARGTYYVSPSGANIPPFTSLSNAANSIDAALSLAAPLSFVLVDAGTYAVTSPISPPAYVTVQSLNGPETTIFDGRNQSRCFRIEHPGVVVSGFTITHGRANNGGPGAWDRLIGGGVLATDGMITGCIIAGNRAEKYGGGVYLRGNARLVNCIVVSNTAGWEYLGGYHYGSGAGGGVAAFGGFIENCVISSNIAYYQGGGIYCEGGSVRGSTITDNRGIPFEHRNSGPTTSEAGGIFLKSGLVENCIVLRNGAKWAGGIYAQSTNAVIRGCVIARNRARHGGGVFSESSVIQNCTVVCNEALHQGGGILAEQGSSIRNTIIQFNTGSEGMNILLGADVILSHCCTKAGRIPETNFDDDPMFIDADMDNFRLLPGSPCVDAGETLDGMADMSDMDLHMRLHGEAPDIGAFELSPESLLVGITADPFGGTLPREITVTAHIAGPHAAPLHYSWDFDGDGSADMEGAGLDVVSHTYTAAGTLAPSVVVTDAGGNTVTGTLQRMLRVSPSILYVSPSGSNVFPYADWGSAATSVHAAVDAAAPGAVVLVTNGTYPSASPVMVIEPITLRSVNGAELTTLDGGGTNRCLWVDRAGAVVEGFTLTRGYVRTPVGGAGAYCGPGSTLRDCIVSRNRTGYGESDFGHYFVGGGINCEGGLVENCLVVSNEVYGDGGGIYLQAEGIARECTLIGNRGYSVRASYYGARAGSGGGICCANSGRVTQCILTDNRAGEGGDLSLRGSANRCLISTSTAHTGEGVRIGRNGSLINSLVIGRRVTIYSGELLNCTITGNDFSYNGAVYAFNARVRNCVVYGNITNHTIRGTSTVWEYTCTTPEVPGVGNITSDPQFADTLYRLSAGSPCIDAGTADGAPDDDFEGTPRPLDGDGDGVPAFDIGAYEFVLPGADSDGDGLDDLTELHSFGSDPRKADTDGDGATDWHEFCAGTDPRDSSSVFTLSFGSTGPSADGVLVRWPSAAGRTYDLYRSTNLVAAGFNDKVAADIPATPPCNTHLDETATGPGPYFYQVCVKYAP